MKIIIVVSLFELLDLDSFDDVTEVDVARTLN